VTDYVDRLDEWLARQDELLADAMTSWIDTEAGLREILLQSRHDASVEALDVLVDTDAGLAAILAAARQAGHYDRDDGDIRLPSTVPDHLLVTAFDRLTARSLPSVARLLSVLRRAHELACQPTPDLRQVVDLDLLLIGEAIEALNDAYLSGVEPGETRLDETKDKVTSAAGCVDCASALLHGFRVVWGMAADYEPFLVSSTTQDRAQVLLDELVAVRERAQALDQARQMQRTLDHEAGLEAVRALDTLLVQALAAGTQKGVTYVLVGVQTLSDLVEGTRLTLSAPADDQDLAQTMAQVLTAEIIRVISLTVSSCPTLDGGDSQEVIAFFDDFTAADLSSADLSGVDLEEVRWSLTGTRWPSGTDIEHLQRQSREVEDGVLVIESGTTLRLYAKL
jgi:hypothetical protein